MTVSRARKLLGNSVNNMTDSEIQKMIDDLYNLAEVISELVDLRGSNRQLGVIDSKKGILDNECRS